MLALARKMTLVLLYITATPLCRRSDAAAHPSCLVRSYARARATLARLVSSPQRSATFSNTVSMYNVSVKDTFMYGAHGGALGHTQAVRPQGTHAPHAPAPHCQRAQSKSQEASQPRTCRNRMPHARRQTHPMHALVTYAPTRPPRLAANGHGQVGCRARRRALSFRSQAEMCKRSGTQQHAAQNSWPRNEGKRGRQKRVSLM